jgi:hypothetical protein
METPDNKELRQFGLLLAVVVTVLWLLFAGTAKLAWMALVVVTIVLLSLAAPAVFKPVRGLMMRVGHVVSKVLNPLLLGFAYFVIITPIGAVMRWFGHDPMRRSFDHSAGSYREPSDDTATHRFDRPF